MEAFQFDNKAVNPPKSPCLPKIKNLFRTVEILAALIFLTSASARLPFAVRITGDFFRRLMTVAASPVFIFAVSNAIALTLFFKSRRHHFPEHSSRLEFITDVGEDHCTHFTVQQPEEVVFQDKETIVEERRVIDARSRGDSSEEMNEKQRRGTAEAGEVDGLSGEEFQRAIEAFIAKQIKFNQEEEQVDHINVQPNQYLLP